MTRHTEEEAFIRLGFGHRDVCREGPHTHTHSPTHTHTHTRQHTHTTKTKAAIRGRVQI